MINHVEGMGSVGALSSAAIAVNAGCRTDSPGNRHVGSPSVIINPFRTSEDANLNHAVCFVSENDPSLCLSDTPLAPVSGC